MVIHDQLNASLKSPNCIGRWRQAVLVDEPTFFALMARSSSPHTTKKQLVDFFNFFFVLSLSLLVAQPLFPLELWFGWGSNASGPEVRVDVRSVVQYGEPVLHRLANMLFNWTGIAYRQTIAWTSSVGWLHFAVMLGCYIVSKLCVHTAPD